jgi:hypothetical protein
MGLELSSRRSVKRLLSREDKRVSIERIKRRRTLQHELFERISPKEYPSIFFDQRLRSRFFR